MASLHFLLLIIGKISASQSVSCTSNTSIQCYIDCKQQTCCNQALDCASMLDCHIGCNGFENRRRLTHKIQKSTQSNARNLFSIYEHNNRSDGCCGSTIYCPFNKNCFIDCLEGCKDVTIHAENASSLLIQNCNSKGNYLDGVYCANMNIYCPQNRHDKNNTNPICIIEGNYIKSTNIYTKQGFHDLELRYSASIIDTNVYCGNTDMEYVCTVNYNGSGCDMIISPNPTAAPTILQRELTLFYSTKQILNEGRIEITSTKYDAIFEEQEQESAVVKIYGLNIEIIILSVVCFFLLMGCMLFCTLWMMRNDKEKENQNKKEEQNVVTQKTNELNDKENDKHMHAIPAPLSLNMDALSVWSVSNIITPRTHSAIMSMCTGNSGMSDINLSFDDIVSTDNGEDLDLNANLKDDEFIIGEDDDDDKYYVPGNQTPINNVQE